MEPRVPLIWSFPGMKGTIFWARAKLFYQIPFIILGSLALLQGTGIYGLMIANLGSIGLYTYICWRWVRKLGVAPQPVLDEILAAFTPHQHSLRYH